MLRVAFYGKGGIGKSTIASNISAVFARAGKKVLHIGCDPKSDSTRYLTGKKIPTILERLKNGEELRLENVVIRGKYGVSCIEVGGPEAGIGCAGIGITTTMGELEKLGVFQKDWDIIIYDVLGDVICGGFSIPLRNHYVDIVSVVTSSDFMSIYAANNIIKGIKRYAGKGKQLIGGIIHNRWKDTDDIKIVTMFSERVNLPIWGRIKESNAIKISDFKGQLIQEKEDEKLLDDFKRIIDSIEAITKGEEPRPMEGVELERFRDEIFERIISERDYI